MFLVTLTNDDSSVIVHRPDAHGVKLLTGQVKSQVNAIPAFEFSMLPNNPGYTTVKPLLTRITVVRTDKNKLVFDGRVLQPKNDLASGGALTRTFTCEGVLAYLHDGVPGYSTLTGTWKAVVTAALAAYNEGVEEWKQIAVGDVPDSGSLTLATTPESDWYDTLYKLVVTDHSYEWRVRADANGKHFLDLASQLGETKSTPKIELARNLQSMSVEADPTSVISRVIPLGATKQATGTATSTDTTTQPRISLADLGKPMYVESADLRAQYGIQVGPQIYDTVTDAKDLEAKATAYLKAERPVTTKYTVTALDLSTIGLDTEDFEAYNTYPVLNPLMSIDEPLRVTAQTIDITAPQNANLTIGDRMKRQSDFALQGLSDTRNMSRKVAGLSIAAEETEKSIVAMQETVTKLKDEADGAGLSGLSATLAEMNNQLTSIFNNVGEIGGEVSALQQTTADHEERIGVIEAKVGIVPAEGGQ